MKLTTRLTYAFAEIKVDETQTTVYKSQPKEIDDLICNLLEVANDLTKYTDKPIQHYIKALDL